MDTVLTDLSQKWPIYADDLQLVTQLLVSSGRLLIQYSEYYPISWTPITILLYYL